MEFSLASATHPFDRREILEDYPQIKEHFKTREESRGAMTLVHITIDSLGDMVKLISIVDHCVIFDGAEITIYDDYLK